MKNALGKENGWGDRRGTKGGCDVIFQNRFSEKEKKITSAFLMGMYLF